MENIKEFKRKFKLIQNPYYFSINNIEDAENAKENYFQTNDCDLFYLKEFNSKFKQLENIKDSWSSQQIKAIINSSGFKSWTYILKGKRSYVQPSRYPITSNCEFTINGGEESVISGNTSITIALKQIFLSAIAESHPF